MSLVTHTERVRVPGRETDVEVGWGIRGRLWPALAARFPTAWRFGLVLDRRVADLWPVDVPPEGPRPIVVHAGPGEAAKTRRSLAHVQDRLLDLRREEPVVAVGGGALLDVAGFAAATVRRGLAWVALPTTVVGMADASVGGKVAVNHPRGKNLLGTFHPPVLVIADVDYLTTLLDRDRLAGLAEIYKAARVADGELLDRLRRGPPRDPSAWTDVLAHAIAVKARIVESDERDHGARRALNFGHTVGHALERLLGGEAIRHGEAVAMGMGVAARIARHRGLIDTDLCERQTEDLARLGLVAVLPPGLDREALLDAMSLDKKRRPGSVHTFVLPVDEVGMVVAEDVSEEEIRRAL